MSIEMPEITAHPRQRIMPSGNCVGSDAAVFERLDSGSNSEIDLAAGRLACEQNCLQKAVCESNTDEIATLIYRESGDTTSFINGEQVTILPSDTRANIIDHPVRFDLREVPTDPGLTLHFIRRGVQTEQLATGPRMPALVKSLADRFLGELLVRDPKLHSWLLNPQGIKKDRAEKGVRDITMLMFQQADYARTAAGIKSETRYKYDRLDPEKHYAVTRLYAQDMRTLAERGYRKPERQALSHSPDIWHQLVIQYSTEINPSDLHYLLANRLLDPEVALRERLARLRILRERHYGEDIADASLRERARWLLDPDNLPAKRKQMPYLTNKQVLAIYAEATETGIVAADKGTPKETIAKLHEVYGDNPFFPPPSYIGRIAYMSVERALGACEKIIKRNAQMAADPELADMPRGFITLVSNQRDYSSPEEVREIYRLRTLADKFNSRSTKNGLDVGPSLWALRRIIDLCDPEEVENVTESVYELLCERQLLCTGLSEINKLQDINFRPQFNDICDPRNGKYTTFAPALRSLRPEERLALACHYGIGKLLYGQEINTTRVAELLDVENVTSYTVDTLLPKCEQLCQSKDKNRGMPVLLMQLNADLDYLERGRASNTAEQRATIDIATIIGGQVMRLGPPGIELETLEDEALAIWLKQTIYERCKPLHQEMATSIEQALRQQILVVSGDQPANYKVSFNERLLNEADEHEIASLAYTLGIDTFMYGCNMGEILRGRLEATIGATAQRLANVVEGLSIRKPVELPETPLVDPSQRGRALGKHQWMTQLSDKISGVNGNENARKRIIQAIDSGLLSLEADDTGQYGFHIPPSAFDTRTPADIAAAINACGVYSYLHNVAKVTLEIEEKSLNQAAVLFRHAVEGLALHASKAFSTNQKSTFSALLAQHLGQNARGPERLTSTDARHFQIGLRRIQKTFELYRSSHLSPPNSRRRSANPHTKFLINTVFADRLQAQTKLVNALRQLPPELTLEEKKYIHRDYLAELINFSRWTAQFASPQ
jgi:hypothetical protein